MAYRSRFGSSGVLYFPGFPNGVKWLLIANTAIFIASFFAQIAGFVSPASPNIFGLQPAAVVTLFFVWQVFTYMFLHGGFGHIVWNMLALWMFGADLEGAWGTRRFLQFYFYCGIGAGLCVILLNYALPWGNPLSVTIGSSGAIFGILMAYAMLYPDRTILFAFLIPLQVKWFVLIIGTITFMLSFQANQGVSNFAHLGGLAVGYLLVRSYRKRRTRTVAAAVPSLRERYKQWKLQRARSKFQVYMKKHGDKGPWVN